VKIIKDKTLLVTLCCFMMAQFLAIGNVYGFSVKDEREYGQEMLAVIRHEFPLLDEPDINQYINKIGQEIVSVAGGQKFNYKFYVINNRDFNAFAAPSGLIFMYSGLMEKMETEGELQSVLAHEVGHVTSRHIAERIDNSAKVNAITLAMVLAGIALGGGAGSQALITGGMATGQAMSMAFTRQNEEEADRKAYTYMVEMGLDPNDMVSMLKTMHRVNQLNMGKVPQYLLTHPKPELRMGYVEDIILMEKPATPAQRDQFYFNRIQARIRSFTKSPESSLPYYRKRIRNAGNDVDKYMGMYGLALGYSSMAQFDKAIEEMEKVMAYYKDKTILITDLGMIYFKKGDLKTAMALFNKGRRLDPGDWWSTYNLAMSLAAIGDNERSLVLFQQLVGHMEDFADAYYQIASIYSKLDNQILAHFNLGKNFYYKGKFKTARYHFSQARNLAPNDKKMGAEIDTAVKIMDEIN
jgi:predicted Zn-dependent protease